ncbi:MAG TPA: BlaI/MecI/CopY family transcriptional regulator [Vicinamibacterales bacterium]|nr:BlaI/MecI/CopY family transcriptional regulator [Vicinamibacterales bacterium]
MPRPTSPTLTDGELRLMRVLWDKGEASVSEVFNDLKEKPKPAYNTVLTLLRILERKGYVTHRKDGRAFVFLPTVDRSNARKSALKSLVDRFFEGSPRLLVLNLLEDEQFSAEALDEVRQRLEAKW